ncbi:MAG TPA: hypothetical protein EYP69_03775, partial [Bacteroidales bacterium]|nr:hypothetical protein [Bacteroidales bacterium]
MECGYIQVPKFWLRYLPKEFIKNGNVVVNKKIIKKPSFEVLDNDK